MSKIISPAVVLVILLLTANVASADDPPITVPLPGMPDGSHVCGSMFVWELVDLDELESRQEQSQQLTPDDDPEVGDRREFYVVNFENSGTTTEYDEVTFELRARSELSEIWVEVDEMGDGKISDDVVQDIHRELDERTAEDSWDPESGIIEIGRQLFGDPPDFDESGRLKTLLVDIQDGWDPEEGGGFIAGFFNPVDQQAIHRNSNQADIIYINTYPGIYTDDREADASRRFGTLAHEYQHLIHHNYGQLNLFQNEGQSEFAEVIKGYDARTMRWLDRPEEIDGTVTADSGPSGLYRWRSSSSDVLLDYQRAQLLHSYVFERTDAAAAGGVTRASSDGKEAYMEVLENFDIDWEEFLRDFQIANRVNDPAISDGKFAYTLPTLSHVRATGIGAEHSSLTASIAGSVQNTMDVEVMYGGGYYSWFQDPHDLKIDLNGEDYIKWSAILTGGDAGKEVTRLEEGSNLLEGSYDEIVLVGANTRETENDENDPGSRNYNYSYEYGAPNIVDADSDLPDDYQLFDAYPNPFNPQTVIRYHLPEISDVRLEVYNALGQQVATLVNERQEAGRYQRVFDAAGLAGGTYIYRLTANDWSRSAAVTLIK